MMSHVMAEFPGFHRTGFPAFQGAVTVDTRLMLLLWMSVCITE